MAKTNSDGRIKMATNARKSQVTPGSNPKSTTPITYKK